LHCRLKIRVDEAHAAGRALGLYAGASFDELAPELVARLESE